MNNKCAGCAESKRCKDNRVSWVFFLIGLIATLAIRIVLILTHISPAHGKMAWYLGIGGFLVFFMYKFKVSRELSRHISGKKLMEKVHGEEQLTKEDYHLIGSILCSISSNKERINYFFIFLSSALALAIAVYFDFWPR